MFSQMKKKLLEKYVENNNEKNYCNYLFDSIL